MHRIAFGRAWRAAAAGGMVVSLALLVGACSPDGSPRESVDKARSAARGQAIFDENCGACHGADGQGPELAQLKALPDAERRDRIRNHPIAGQIPQRLPANELFDVTEFLGAE